MIYEGKQKQKVLYVRMIKALYGMMIASILYYKKFRKDIESIGFELNPNDMSVVNRMVNGKQHTVTWNAWHIDDVKSIHVDPKVNAKFHTWCEQKYGSEETGHILCGKRQDYLAMIQDYLVYGVLKVDKRYFVDSIIKDFPYELNPRSLDNGLRI